MLAQAIPLRPLTDPAQRIEHWHVARLLNPAPRATENEELLELVGGLIEDFRQIRGDGTLAIDVEFKVSEVEDEASADGDDGAQAMAESLTLLLELVRRSRARVTGFAGERIVEAVRALDPRLATEYQRELDAALPFFDEYEKLLVIWGAGTDEDADLGFSIVPTAEELGFLPA